MKIAEAIKHLSLENVGSQVDSQDSGSTEVLGMNSRQAPLSLNTSDLGLLGHYRVRRVDRKNLEAAIERVSETEKRRAADLAVTALEHHYDLQIEKLRIAFTTQFSHLATRAAAAQWEFGARMQALLGAFRARTYDSRGSQYDRIRQLYKDGLITDEEFHSEMAWVISSVQELFREAEASARQQVATVRNACKKR